jgi:hypothetical protein
MAEKPVSPFAGLEKALLRSTQQPTPPSTVPGPRAPVPPTPRAAAKEPRRQDTKAPRSQGAKEPRLQGDLAPRSQDATNEGPPTKLSHYQVDFADPSPGERIQFRVTKPEAKALAYWLMELDERFDLTTSQQDLIRCALQHASTDYEQNGDASTVVVLLRKRRKGK